jgi:hypothetical protein
MGGPVFRRLGAGRLHLQHGPIDLIVTADGGAAGVERAFGAAIVAFEPVLETLVAELAVLKAPLRGDRPPSVAGPVARRMIEACWPYRAVYITPMAAVAGAVAEQVLRAMVGAAKLERAIVNNGGDIALYLAPGAGATVGVVERPDKPHMAGTFVVEHASPVRGVATSGWRGRSQSLGIADAVTVLARSAPEADAAATIIANAVDVAHPAVRRLPASAVKDDSDLGDLPVTVDVGALPPEAISEALDHGAAEARRLLSCGLIEGAVLLLTGELRVIGGLRGSGPLSAVAASAAAPLSWRQDKS